MNSLSTYFPLLTPGQAECFVKMESLYREWNARINVISRKDIDHTGIHHILHSLAIAKFAHFKPGTSVMDAGTGGGFPGIPLAVMFPEVQFTLVDSIGKKIKVVEAVAEGLGLKNVVAMNTRFESVDRKFDFVTGRAVSNLPLFLSMVRPCIKKQGFNALPNGVLYLTGGEIDTDLQKFRSVLTTVNLQDYFTEDYFATKKLVHLYNF
ncbi:MAG: 16S rRNA (guanine(527)-N(7))-methyltransferase RsmG [Bacteroidota bacterium]